MRYLSAKRDCHRICTSDGTNQQGDANVTGTGWTGWLDHSERHHPDQTLLLPSRLSALRPVGRKRDCLLISFPGLVFSEHIAP